MKFVSIIIKNLTRIENYFVIVCIMAFFLVSCVYVEKKGNPTEDSLLSLAKYYWQNRIEGVFDKIYEMEDRDTRPKTFQEYADKAGAIRKFQINQYEIKRVEVKDYLGYVDIEISFYMPISSNKPFKQVLYDKWIFKDSTWVRKFEY